MQRWYCHPADQLPSILNKSSHISRTRVPVALNDSHKSKSIDYTQRWSCGNWSLCKLLLCGLFMHISTWRKSLKSYRRWNSGVLKVWVFSLIHCVSAELQSCLNKVDWSHSEIILIVKINRRAIIWLICNTNMYISIIDFYSYASLIYYSFLIYCTVPSCWNIMFCFQLKINLELQ